MAGLTGGVFCLVLRSGGGDYFSSALALLLWGCAALVGLHLQNSNIQGIGRIAVVSAVLFLSFGVLQLVPLPIALLDIVSEARADLARRTAALADASAHFATISIAPERTAYQLSRLAGYILVFFVLGSFSRLFPTKRWLLLLPLIALGIIQAASGFAQGAAGEAVTGTFASRNFFAGFLAMVLPCALMWGISLLASQQNNRRVDSAVIGVLLCVSALAMFVAITMAVSRMGFISSLLSVAIVAFLAMSQRASASQRTLAALALVTATSFLLLFAPSDDLMVRLGATASDETLGGRLPIFSDTLRMVRDYPLLGVGMGAYFPGLLPYQEHLLNYTVSHAHNDYVQSLSELGIVGLIGPAFFVASVLALNIRRCLQAEPLALRAFPIAVVGGLSAMLIHCSADFNFYIPANAATFFWIAGIGSAGNRSPSTCLIDRKTLTPYFTAALALGAILYSASWLAFVSEESSAEREAQFCAIWVCDTSVARNGLQERFGDLASVPPHYLQALVRREPAAPYVWCDLGDSLMRTGKVEEARRCFAQAIHLAPRIPFMLIRVARFYFSTGNIDEGLALSARALDANPAWAPIVYADYDTWNISSTRVVTDVLPANTVAAGHYLRYLTDRGRYEDADFVWRWMLTQRAATESTARTYTEALLKNVGPRSAFEAWRGYVSSATDNLVSNYGFETDPISARFDWSVSKVPGLIISFDDEMRHSGTRSLRIDFRESLNPTELGVREAVYLEGGRYRLQAYVRTRDLSTDEGVLLSVRNDQGSPRLDVATPDVKGTTGWTLVEQEFDAPVGGGLVWVRVSRQRSFRFDRYVSGTAWIDDVSITRVPPA